VTTKTTVVCDVCGATDTFTIEVPIDKGRGPTGVGTVERHICEDHFDNDTFKRGLLDLSCRIIESRNGEPLAVQVESGPRTFYIGPDADHAATRLFELFSEL